MKHKSKLLPTNYKDATQRQVAKAMLLRYRPEAKPNEDIKKDERITTCLLYPCHP